MKTTVLGEQPGLPYQEHKLGKGKETCESPLNRVSRRDYSTHLYSQSLWENRRFL